LQKEYFFAKEEEDDDMRRKEEYKQNNFNGNVNFTGKTHIAAGDKKEYCSGSRADFF